MPWMIPSVIATMAGTAVLVVCYFYLYSTDRQKYLLIWAISWVIYFTRYVFLLVMLTQQSHPLLLIGNQLAALISGVLLLYGSYLFINKPFPRLFFLVTAGAAVWIITSILGEVPFVFMSLPTFTFLAATYIWTGLLFFRQAASEKREKQVVGAAFILWGLHKADYPFLRPVLWFAPWGYLLGACLEFIVALGLLMVYFKKTKADLRANEERLKILIQKSPLPMVVTDLNQNPVYVNEKFTASFGYTLADVPTAEKWWPTAYPDPDYRQQVKAAWTAAIDRARANQTDIETQEWEIAIKDGTRRLCEFYMVPLDTLGLIVIKDITAQRATEEQLRQAQKMEAIGRLAGGVAHDFNNMLSIISGNVEMLLEDAGFSELQADSLAEIQKAAARSADLTRQLLAFARKQTISLQVIDLNATLKSALNMLSRLIGENITLQWSPADNLWPVKCDPSQVDQVLANLCLNARDAIDKRGVIRIETANVSLDGHYPHKNSDFYEGDFVCLTVSDTGCGMAPEMIENLFEPFYTTKEFGRGTGLGLATVYGIIKQNNGFINVYSELNHGTTFKLFWPRHLSEEAPTDVPGTSWAELTGPKVILLVEDEPAILKMSTKMLENLGYAVLACSDPAEAIRLGQSHPGPIDLLMTDVVMPQTNGRELAGRLLELRPQLKCLYMSGYTREVIARHGVLEEDLYFIGKPFSKQQLAETLGKIFDQPQ